MSDEYQYFKVKFHRNRYRRLLELITELADGESLNLAMRDQIIIWFENERRNNLPPLGQERGLTPPNMPQPGQDEVEDDLAALDDVW